MKIKTLTTLTLITFLSGCNFFKDTSYDDLPIEDAVTVGTLAYIDSDPRKAQEVVDFIGVAKGIQNEDGSLNAVEINKLVQESIDYSELEPYQAFAIQALLVRIVGKFNEVDIDPETKVRVEDILNIAEQTARNYL